MSQPICRSCGGSRDSERHRYCGLNSVGGGPLEPVKLDMTADRAFLLDNAPAVLDVLRKAWEWQQDRATGSEDLRLHAQAKLDTAVAALGEPPA